MIFRSAEKAKPGIRQLADEWLIIEDLFDKMARNMPFCVIVAAFMDKNLIHRAAAI